MKRRASLRSWRGVGLSVAGVGAVAVLGMAVGGACSSSPAQTTVFEGGDKVAPYGPVCSAPPGVYPNSSCDLWDAEVCPEQWDACEESANAPDMLCNPNSECLAMADNTGKSTYDFRLRKLTIVAPAAISDYGFIGYGILDPGIMLNGYCSDTANALHGAFNWLARFDPVAQTVMTGGAPPSDDPFDAGYCFAQFNAQVDGGPSVPIAPVVYNVISDGGSFSTDPSSPAVQNKLYVPIFQYGHTDPADLIVLPLSHPIFSDVTIAPDHNCIGTFYNGAIKDDCSDEYQSCTEWHTAGAIGGFITLQDANSVVITLDQDATLCSVLAGVQGTCTPDGGPVEITSAIHGDFCSTTMTAGGCQDSFWLAATFAASAVNINDGTTNPLCNGIGETGDGGAPPPVVDSGTGDSAVGGSDAGSDSGNADAGSDAAEG